MERMTILFRSNSGAKPNPVKGLYTALAMFLPLLVLTMLGQSAFGVLVMTGALLTSFGDVGTSYRTRAWSLGMTAVGGGPWWVEVVEILLVVFIGGLLSVYGRVAAGMGLLLTIPFVSSLANRSGPATARPAAGGFLLGGAILMLFALLFAWLPSPRSTPRNEVRPNRSQPTLNTLPAQLTLTSPQTASLMMALQNVVATYLGALLADVLIADVQNALVLELIVVAITFLAFTPKDLNYLLYFFFFTILFLLLISIGMSGQSLAVWRVVTTLIGAGIVFVMTFLSQLSFLKDALSDLKERKGAEHD